MTKPKIVFLLLVLVASAAGAYLLLAPKPDARALAERAFYAIEDDPFNTPSVQQAFRDIARAKAVDADEPWVAIAMSRAMLEMGYRSGDRYRKRSYTPVAIDKALEYAERGATLAPADSEAQSQLARVQIIQGELKTAWYTLNRAHDADAGNFSPWYLRSVIFVQMKDTAKASMALDEAERLATRPYQVRVVLQERMGVAKLNRDLDGEERLHLAIIALNTRNPHSHGNYGAFLLTHKRYDEAIAQYETALSIARYPLAEKQLEKARRRGQ